MLALDTNTISYYLRGDPSVVLRLQAQAPSDVGVPTVVAYELVYGLRRLAQEVAAPRLDALERLLRPMASLAFDVTCAEHAARIRAQLERQGAPIGPHDVLIAATAIGHHATLVTRNVREFSRVEGLQLVNWHAS